MSFGIGASDIEVGVKLALKIYDYGFAEENRADVRYSNFRHEILNFHYLLQRLGEALERAHQRFEKREAALGQRPYDPSSQEFEDERKAIVGNFLETLQECEALLENNKQHRLRSNINLDSLWSILSRQEVQVDQLRLRLNFHSQKIRLVIDRLSLNLLTDLDEKVDNILAASEQSLNVSNEIKLIN